ncbi:hypothetical protein GJAV_G00193500 [Gymnothorax javanicus]|nr:hypothetical protein GJAV_G00193500 [Gymnothorax javanicus]
MGNQESQGINAQGADGKLENGAANGHVTISPEDPNGIVASETAVQQNSQPPQPTKETSPPSENGVDNSKDKSKDPPPVTKSLALFSFSKIASPSNDAPEEPSEPPVSDKVSVEEDESQQSPEPASEPPDQKSEKKGKLFGKVFKKKNKGEKDPTSVESDSPSEDQDQAIVPQTLTNGLNSEPGDVKETTTAGKASETLPGTPAGGQSLEVDGKTANQVETEKPESTVEDGPMMNFFRTFVSPSKPPKEEASPAPVPVEEVKVSEEPELAAPAEPSSAGQPAGSPTTEPKAPLPAVRLSVVAPFGKLFKTKALKSAKKDPAAKGTQEVDASGAAQASKPSPPPPPSEPPKPEDRVDPAAKPAAGAQKEADASKQPEGAGVQKPAKGSPFRKLFQSKKEEEEEEAQPVEEAVPETGDAKATDARVTPDQSPKAEKKPNLISIFKPMKS